MPSQDGVDQRLVSHAAATGLLAEGGQHRRVQSNRNELSGPIPRRENRLSVRILAGEKVSR
jgi:hypothetical protein